MNFSRLLIWSLLGAVLGAAALFPLSDVSLILSLLFCLIIAILYRVSPRPTNLELLLCGLVFHLLAFYWIPSVIKAFFASSLLISWFCALIVLLVSSLQFVFLNLLYRGLNRGVFKRFLIALPSAWLAVEVLVPKFIPWNLGHMQISFSNLVQCTDLLGLPLVSWLVLWWAALAAEMLTSCCAPTVRPKRELFTLAAAGISVFVLVVVYGMLRVDYIEKINANAPGIDIGLIQGNLNPKKDYIPEKVESNLEKYRKLSIKLLSTAVPDILVWPESAVNIDYYEDELQLMPGAGLNPFPGLQLPLVFGGQIRLRRPYEKIPQYYTSAVVLMPSGDISQRYHKQILFPFSEEIPLQRWLPVLNRFDNKGYQLRNGQDQKPISIQLQRLRNFGKIGIGVVICYEDTWPSVFRGIASSGKTHLFLTLSNNNWFLRSLASRQHLWLASTQALAFRKYLVRATNDGITAVVSPVGKVTAQIPAFSEGAMIAKDVKLLEHKTFFQYWGLWPLKVLSVFFLIYALFGTTRAVQPK